MKETLDAPASPEGCKKALICIEAVQIECTIELLSFADFCATDKYFSLFSLLVSAQKGFGEIVRQALSRLGQRGKQSVYIFLCVVEMRRDAQALSAWRGQDILPLEMRVKLHGRPLARLVSKAYYL